MSSNKPSTFGSEVKRLRQQRGMSQSDLAKKVSCAVDTIRKIENNLSYRPSKALAEKLAHVLGIVDTEEIATFVGLARLASTEHRIDYSIESKTNLVLDKTDQGLESNNEIFPREMMNDTLTSHENRSSREVAAFRVIKWLETLILIYQFRILLIVVILILFIFMNVLVLQWLSHRSIMHLRGSIPLISPANSNELNPALEWQKGSSLDSTYILNQATGSLKLIAGGQTIFGKEGNTAPMMMLPVQGDFTAQVMITFHPGSVCCKHAGMGIRVVDNEGAWIRISKDHADTIQVDGLLNGYSTNSFVTGYVSDRVWLKIDRQDDKITLSYSEDGVNWMFVRKDYIFDVSENVQILLFVYSAYNSDSVSADFVDLIVN